jgi:hypothetical protein
MRNRVQIENIEEMRRRQGIEDVALHEPAQEEMPAGSWLTPHWQRDWEVRITNDRVTVLPALEHGG